MITAGRMVVSARSMMNCVSCRTTSTSAQLSSQLKNTVKVVSVSFPQPPDPLSCCGNGCQNCVWIQYADDVSAFFDKPDDPSTGAQKILNKFKAVKKEMEEHVDDPNLRAYLLMEIKAKLAQK